MKGRPAYRVRRPGHGGSCGGAAGLSQSSGFFVGASQVSSTPGGASEHCAPTSFVLPTRAGALPAAHLRRAAPFGATGVPEAKVQAQDLGGPAAARFQQRLRSASAELGSSPLPSWIAAPRKWGRIGAAGWDQGIARLPLAGACRWVHRQIARLAPNRDRSGARAWSRRGSGACV